jgi:hypothetical protein
MKVGNLVSVKRTHGREPVIGVIIEIKEDEHNRVALVESIKGGHRVYASPLDVEVISDCR